MPRARRSPRAAASRRGASARAPRAPPPSWRCALPGPRAAPSRPPRAGAVRGRRLPRLPALPRLGRRAPAARRSSTACCWLLRRASPTSSPFGLVGGRRRARHAPGAARRAAVPRGGALPARGADAGATPPARSGSAPARRAPRLGAAHFEERGGALGEALYAGASHARSATSAPHPRGLPVPRRRAPADRRVDRRRDPRDRAAGVADTTRVIRRTRGARDRPLGGRAGGVPAAAAAARARGRASRSCAPASARRRLDGAEPLSRTSSPRQPTSRERTRARPEPRAEPEPTAGAARARAEARARARRRGRAARRRTGEFVTCPTRRCCAARPPTATQPDTADQERVATALVEALGHHGVEAKVVGTVAGPHITRYELRLAPGVKMNKVGNLKDDLAYALAATEIRILAPIPGKQAVGVEVPNRRRRVVTLGDVYGAAPPDASPLTVFLGKDVSGKPVHADLAKMPHLLVAGTTGAGKSGCVNAMLELDPAARDARPGAARARRPQAGRAQPLRGDPAPADAGHHEPADGRQRAAEPRPRDGVALRRHVASRARAR